MVDSQLHPAPTSHSPTSSEHNCVVRWGERDAKARKKDKSGPRHENRHKRRQAAPVEKCHMISSEGGSVPRQPSKRSGAKRPTLHSLSGFILTLIQLQDKSTRCQFDCKGFPNQHRSSSLQPSHHRTVLRRNTVAVRVAATCCTNAGCIVDVLDPHGDTVQRRQRLAFAPAFRRSCRCSDCGGSGLQNEGVVGGLRCVDPGKACLKQVGRRASAAAKQRTCLRNRRPVPAPIYKHIEQRLVKTVEHPIPN
eukprot:COSAG02_NODE_3324_length_6938_cov_3.226641_7_plen_250_part_00